MKNDLTHKTVETAFKLDKFVWLHISMSKFHTADFAIFKSIKMGYAKLTILLTMEESFRKCPETNKNQRAIPETNKIYCCMDWGSAM